MTYQPSNGHPFRPQAERTLPPRPLHPHHDTQHLVDGQGRIGHGGRISAGEAATVLPSNDSVHQQAFAVESGNHITQSHGPTGPGHHGHEVSISDPRRHAGTSDFELDVQVVTEQVGEQTGNHRSGQGRERRRLHGGHYLSILLSLVLFVPTLTAQTVPTGFQEYFVLGHEQHIWNMLESVRAAEAGVGVFANGMNSVVSATASADNQVITYDHWEDGLEADILNPVQATTLLIGDGNNANGRACDFTTDPRIAPCNGTNDDVLFAGSFVNFNSDQGLGCAAPPNDLNCSVPVNPRVVTDIRYDGGDFLTSSGGPLSLVHPQDPLSPFIGGATEIIPRQAVADATSYTIPIGEDIYAGNNSVTEPFKYVELNLVAFDDNTQVNINSPGAGNISFTLNRGEHYSSQGLIDGVAAAGITVNAGTRISTTGPIAGLMFTGGDGTFATRLYTLLPDILHSTDYIITAPGDDPAAQGSRPLNLYVFNPDPLNSLAVTATDSLGTTVINIPSGSQVDYFTGTGRFVPANSTVRLTSPGRFWGVSAYSHQSPANDWGHSWLARKFVTTTYTVTFAPGVNNPSFESQLAQRQANDPNCTIPPAGPGVCDPLNRSPIFVSATADNTEIQIDFDNDGTFDVIDLDGDDFPDPAPFPNNTYVINALSALRVYDHNDYDNTGTLVVANKPVAVAYGQDTDQATGPDPIQDTGYAIYPINQLFLDPTLVIDKSVDVSVVPLSGGMATYTLTVSAFDFGPISNLQIYDLLDLGLSTSDYVPGSTLITYPDLSQNTADPALSTDAGTGRPRLDWTLSPDSLQANQTLTVQYSVQIPASTARTVTNEAHAEGTFGGSMFSPLDTADVVQADLDLSKAVTDDGTPEAGEILTYTLTVANNSVAAETNVVLADAIPPDTTFVPASITSSGPFTGVYNPGQNAVEWTAVTFPVGGPHSLTFQVQVNPGTSAGTVIPNVANYESDQTPLFPSNEVETTLVGPFLVVAKRGPTLLHPNETATFEITVDNTGAGTANNVRIVDFFPANTTYVSESMVWRKNVDPLTAVTDAADADEGIEFGDRLELLIPTLGSGQDLTFRFQVLVDPGTDGLNVNNQATVTSDEVTPTFTNLVQVPIVGNADITGHVFLDVDGNGTQDPGEPDLPNIDVQVSTINTDYGCAPASALTDDSYDGTLGSMTCCSIIVPTSNFGASPAITDLDVELALNHTFVGDLTVKLVSPTNQILTLLNRPGSTAPDDGTSPNFGNATNWSADVITFDDDGGGPSAETLGSLLAGGDDVCADDSVCNYTPAPDTAGGLANLAGYDGSDPRGTWQLCVGDGAAGDVGTFLSANLVVMSTDAVATVQTVTTDANGDYLATVNGTQVTVDVQESDPDFPPGATLSTANDPQMVTAIPGATVATTPVGYEPPTLTFTKTSDAVLNQVVPGQTVTYTMSVTNNSTVTQTGIDLNDPLPTGTNAVPGSTTVAVTNPSFRVTEYFLANGTFTGTTHDLALNQALVSNYFAIVQGSDGNGANNGNRGPDENYAAITQDPFGTGSLGTSAGPTTLRLERGNAVNSWVGVVTVVECLSDCAASGFTLLDVQRVAHTGSATSGNATSGTPWSDIGQTMLLGGFNGAGCDTSEASSANQKVCHVRLFPSGSDQINWTRDAGGATLSTATSTVMVVEWGSEWTVQRVRVQGSNAGDGANAVGEYNTAAISSVARANTWVWGTGHTDDNGVGDASEGVLLTLGDGVNQNANETLVAAGMEAPNNLDFEIYALTHDDLAVDQRFKIDGDSAALTVDVPVDAATANRMALSYNGLNSTNNAYPRPHFSARYLNDTTVRLERRRFNQPFPAWVQGIDFSAILGTTVAAGGDPPNLVVPADGYTLLAGGSMTVTFQVEIDDPLAGGITQITNIATLETDQQSPQDASVTDDVQRLGVTVEPNNAGFAVPGGSVTYTHVVTNTGQQTDSYSLTLESELGYTVELLDPATGTVIATDSNGDGVWDGGATVNTGALAVGASMEYRVRVNVPGGATVGTEETTTLTATSDTDGSAAAFATDETTVVDSLDLGPVALTPDHSGVVTAGGSIAYTHAVINNTGMSDTFDLTAFPTLAGWTATIYNDSNGDGVYSPGIDVAISNTLLLSDGQLQTIFVVVDAPPGAMAGDADVVHLTAISQADSSLFDAATDTTTVVPATTHDLSGGGTLLVDPSDIATFPGTVKNLTDTDDRYDFTITASPFLGLDGLDHPTQLWIDTNADGVPDTQIAEDTDGDGTWDTIAPGFDTDGDNAPDVAVAAGDELAYELRRPVDAMQLAYRDPITLTATSQNTGEADSVTTTNLLAAVTHAMLEGLDITTVGNRVVIAWRTTLEHRTAGFLVERQRPDGTFQPLHRGILPALPSAPAGGVYRFVDPSATLGQNATYILREVEIDGRLRLLAQRNLLLDPQKLATPSSPLPAAGFSREAVHIPAPRATQRPERRNFESRNSPAERLRLAVRGPGLYFVSAETIADQFQVAPAEVAALIVQGQLRLHLGDGSQPAFGSCPGDPGTAERIFSDGFESGDLCAWSNGRGLAIGTGVAWLAAPDNGGIYFYAQGIDSIYTDTRIYWLEQGPAVRMATTPAGSPAPVAGQTYLESRHFEEESLPLTSVIEDPDGDFWFWNFVAVIPEFGTNIDTMAVTLPTPGKANTTGQASLRVHLQAETRDDAITPDHRAEVWLNGVRIGSSTWDGSNAHTLTVNFDQSLLVEGDNTLEIKAPADTGIASEIFYLDAVDLSYARTYTAVADHLTAAAGSHTSLAFEGFTRNDVAVFDLTRPHHPRQVVDPILEADGSGFRVRFTSTPGGTYLATPLELATELIPEPAQASDLSNRGNRARYVVIAADGLEAAAQPLVDHRRAQGLEAKLVRLQDIYDEFNQGVVSPWALRDFLAHAQAWATPPRFVVLVGDSSFDFKDRLGHGGNLLPAPMINTPDGLFPSDHRTFDLTGDGVPEVAVGRLPVRNPDELTGYITKLIAHETGLGTTADWNRRTVWIADAEDEGGEFIDDSELLIGSLSGNLTVDRIYVDQLGDAPARQEVLDTLDSGALLVNFLGHANLLQMGNGSGLLRRGDVPGLNNGSRLPVLSAMTCALGRFDRILFDTLSEQLVLTPHGGVIALWAPTGFAFNEDGLMLGSGFLPLVLETPGTSLGEAIQAALAAYLEEAPEPAPHVPFTYTLLGDPAVRLRP